jgi:serine/threonine protein kinase
LTYYAHGLFQYFFTNPLYFSFLLFLSQIIKYKNTIDLIKKDGKIDKKFFKLKKIIGKGAFGVVYKSKIFNLKVAIKKLSFNESNQSLILKELNFLKQCYHDNIVELFGYSIDNNHIYLIFDLIKGGDLTSTLKSKILNDKEKLNVLLGVAKGMKYLHGLNILHRGIVLFYCRFKSCKYFN